MKYLSTLFVSVLCILPALAQKEDYWQQEVNYTIAVTLNDEEHTLLGEERIEYINHSPDDLNFIYFHLWPNAYKNNSTAFAKQQLLNGSRKFQFASDSARGFIDGLDWKVNGQAVRVEPDPENIDVVKLLLNEPLRSGQKIEITTPFRVKLPDSFSRLGHVGQSYQITQWYPKPAVYDKRGWHPMPYLNQGEFYSEYGRFDVKITLPANYTVGATGVLQNRAEYKRLDSLAAIAAEKRVFPSADPIPPSDNRMKTLHYIQDNIHDFGWFADKRFNVLKSEVELPHSKRKVTTWLLFLNQDAATWVRSVKDLNDAIYYYSLWVGDYPYDHATAVDGALSAGSGMEYPMVTVTDPQAIIHEVGHNWFYGILGTNERQYPWLDEGVNSYYEFRIGELTDRNYSQLSGLLKDRNRVKSYRLQDIHGSALNLLLYQIAATRGLDQPVELTSAAYTNSNYGSIVYMKTGVLFKYLENYLTKERFDKAMRNYFDTWKFKHPYPEDMEAVFERTTGEQLDWFFHDLIKTNYAVDGALTEVEKTGDDAYRVTVKNKGKVLAPVPIAARDSEGNILEVKWTKPGQEEQQLTFTTPNIDEFVLDPGYFVPELNRSNNRIAVAGLLPRFEKIRLQPLLGIEQFDRRQIYFAPVGGYNTYDKIMFGAALYNSSLFQKKVNYLLMPMYSIGQSELRGIGNLNVRFLPKTGPRVVKLGLNAQRFERFLKLEPSITFDLSGRVSGALQQNLELAFTTIRIEDKIFNEGTYRPASKTLQYQIPGLRYSVQKQNGLQGLGAELNLDLVSGDTIAGVGQDLSDSKALIGKLALTYNRFYSPTKKVKARLFLGTVFNGGSRIPGAFQLGLSGSPDYKKETIFLDRSQLNENLLAFVRQTDGRDGAFRNYVPVFSSRWLATLNLDAEIPKVPLTAYLDLGTAYQAQKLFYGTGISVSLIRNYIQIYLPVAGSNYAQDIPKNFDEFKNNIRFLLRLNALNPFRLVSEVVE